MITLQGRCTANDASMIPLINIVFLLLIFFMIAGQIASTPLIPVSLPTAASEAPAELATLELVLGSRGELVVNDQYLSMEQLPALLTALAVDDPTIAIKADAGLPASALTPALRALHQAGLRSIRLHTRAETPR